MSTGKWRDPDVPHRGWTHHGCEDTGELSTTCEMCEKETIRHVHYVTHPDFPDELRIGCVCAEIWLWVFRGYSAEQPKQQSRFK